MCTLRFNHVHLEILTWLAGSKVHHCQHLTFALLVLGRPKLAYILYVFLSEAQSVSCLLHTQMALVQLWGFCVGLCSADLQHSALKSRPRRGSRSHSCPSPFPHSQQHPHRSRTSPAGQLCSCLTSGQRSGWHFLGHPSPGPMLFCHSKRPRCSRWKDSDTETRISTSKTSK